MLIYIASHNISPNEDLHFYIAEAISSLSSSLAGTLIVCQTCLTLLQGEWSGMKPFDPESGDSGAGRAEWGESIFMTIVIVIIGLGLLALVCLPTWDPLEKLLRERRKRATYIDSRTLPEEFDMENVAGAEDEYVSSATAGPSKSESAPY